MHIKQVYISQTRRFADICVKITIQGFKSYKDQTKIDPFSPRHNVVGTSLLSCVYTNFEQLDEMVQGKVISSPV